MPSPAIAGPPSAFPLFETPVEHGLPATSVATASPEGVEDARCHNAQERGEEDDKAPPSRRSRMPFTSHDQIPAIFSPQREQASRRRLFSVMV